MVRARGRLAAGDLYGARDAAQQIAKECMTGSRRQVPSGPCLDAPAAPSCPDTDALLAEVEREFAAVHMEERFDFARLVLVRDVSWRIAARVLADGSAILADERRRLSTIYEATPHPGTYGLVAEALLAVGDDARGRKARARALAAAETLSGTTASLWVPVSPGESVGPLFLSEDFRTVALVMFGRGVQVWDTVTGSPKLRTPDGSLGAVLSNDGRWLATKTTKGIDVYEVGSGERAATLEIVNLGPMAFVNGGGVKLAAVGMASDGVLVFDIQKGSQTKISVPMDVGGPRLLASAPDGSTVGGLTHGRALVLLSEDEPTRVVARDLPAPNFAGRLVVAPRGARFAYVSGSLGNDVTVVGADGSVTTHSSAKPIKGLQFLGDGALLTVDSSGLHARDGVIDDEGPAARPDGFSLRAAGVSASGAVARLADDPDHDAGSPRGLTRTLVEIVEPGSTSPRALPDRTVAGTNGVAFAPDGGTLAVASGDRTVTLWTPGRDPRAFWAGAALHSDAVAWVDGGDGLAVAEGWDVVQVWDPLVGELRETHSHRSEHLASSRDGTRLAIVTAEGVVERSGDRRREARTIPLPEAASAAYGDDDVLWVVASGQLYRVGEGQPQSVSIGVSAPVVSGAGFIAVRSENGGGLKLGGDGGEFRDIGGGEVDFVRSTVIGECCVYVGDLVGRVTAFDIETGSVAWQRTLHHGSVSGLSRSGGLIATASSDGTTRLVDAETGDGVGMMMTLPGTALGTRGAQASIEWVAADADDHVDGSRVGRWLVWWRAGDYVLPGPTGWARQARPDLVGALLGRAR